MPTILLYQIIQNTETMEEVWPFLSLRRRSEGKYERPPNGLSVLRDLIHDLYLNREKKKSVLMPAINLLQPTSKPRRPVLQSKTGADKQPCVYKIIELKSSVH